MSTRIPTVNDLRVKLCYICREEENAETPQDSPPRAWTHPCTCTLVAHEQCLLKWIQTSQSSASRAPNALKCPQCGTQYEMTSDEPIVLRGLALGNKVLQRVGRYLTVFGAAAAVGVVGTSIYVCLTGYGAWAVQKFIGRELFDVLLTDDPANWPWSAYLNLPLIPISLIVSRFQSTHSSTVIPLLLAWPPTFPANEASRKRMIEHWSRVRLGSGSGSWLGSGVDTSTWSWPPPPILFGLVGLPIVRALYRRCYAHVYARVLGVPMPEPRLVGRAGAGGGGAGGGAGAGGLRFDEGPFVIRIRANLDGGADEDGGVGGVGDAADDLGQGQPGAGVGVGAVAQDPDPDPNAAAVEAAEQLIEINASSLGRRIGGALVIPFIASSMGSLLLSLSKHSRVLRAVLGIHHQHRRRVGGGGGGSGGGGLFGFGLGSGSGSGNGKDNGNGNGSFLYPYPYPPWLRTRLELGLPLDKKWSDLSLLQQSKFGARLLVNAFLSGTKSWEELDPVWWRNGLGFGLFVVVKDSIQLLHLWLAKRELESRRVKDKDFRGVDVRELDLLPSFFQSPSSSVPSS